jgi:hypothetical protein
MLLLDSDILFFASPKALLDLIDDRKLKMNSLNKDWGQGYTVNPETLRPLLDFEFPPFINSGLGLIHRGSIHFDWVEEFLALPGILSHPHQIEQTLIALCSARFGFVMLPSEYDVRLESPPPGAPSRHYTGPIRHLMYSEGIRRLKKAGFSTNSPIMANKANRRPGVVKSWMDWDGHPYHTLMRLNFVQ